MAKVRFRPMPGKIVVKPEHTVAGGYKLPGSNLILMEGIGMGNETPHLGRVIAVYEPFVNDRDGEETTPFIEVGDRVLYGKHAGIKLTVGRESFLALRETEILSIVEFEDAEDLEKVEVFLPADYDAKRLNKSLSRPFIDEGY